MKPLISIIIPTFNRAHLIGETLASIIDQNYQNWECIIVDDSSTDDTLKRLEKYRRADARIKLFSRPKELKKGANACRNHGFDKTKGKYILFFDSDDILMPQTIENAVEVFEKAPELDFVFYDYNIFVGNTQNIVFCQKNYSQNPFPDYFSGKINLATSAVIWRKNLIIGQRFNPDLKKSQELNFIFHVYKNAKHSNIAGSYLNFVGLLVRRHSHSIVMEFQNSNLNYLLSDLYVKNELCQHFKNNDGRIFNYNLNLLKESSKKYLKESNINSFKSLLLKLKCNYILKLELLIYKLVSHYSGRSYRFNLAMKKLMEKDFHFKFQ